jgi:hypothetical protein
VVVKERSIAIQFRKFDPTLLLEGGPDLPQDYLTQILTMNHLDHQTND